MTIDVIDLRDFYSQRLGIVARRLINRGIHARWPEAEGRHTVTMRSEELAMLVNGLDLKQGRQRNWYRKSA